MSISPFWLDCQFEPIIDAILAAASHDAIQPFGLHSSRGEHAHWQNQVYGHG
jgi:hypothetical protein